MIKINEIVSQEIDNIQSKNFEKAIEERKEILGIISPFERFAAEFTGYWLHPDRCKFKSICDLEPSGKRFDLFKGYQEGIISRIKVINALISLFAREHENILNLKNLEFNKKMQDMVLRLTILIIILTLIQLEPLIMNFLTWLMN